MPCIEVYSLMTDYLVYLSIGFMVNHSISHLADRSFITVAQQIALVCIPRSLQLAHLYLEAYCIAYVSLVPRPNFLRAPCGLVGK